jgi:sterol regulatory element-binding transcription factor 1
LLLANVQKENSSALDIWWCALPCFLSVSQANKSAILKKAIDRIRHLESMVSKLKEENMLLRQVCQQNAVLLPHLSSAGAGSPLSPTDSMDANSPGGSISSHEAGSPASVPVSMLLSNGSPQVTGVPTQSVAGFLDRSRLALCAFMFAFVVVFNPLGLFVDTGKFGSIGSVFGSGDTSYSHGSEHQGYSGRTILSEEGTPLWYVGWAADVATTWALNAVFLVCGLAWLLVYGEPIFFTTSPGAKHFWEHRQQAMFCLAVVCNTSSRPSISS